MSLDDETFSENNEIDDDLIDYTPQPDENDCSFYRKMNNKFQKKKKIVNKRILNKIILSAKQMTDNQNCMTLPVET